MLKRLFEKIWSVFLQKEGVAKDFSSDYEIEENINIAKERLKYAQNLPEHFWEYKKLHEMSEEEWELLCDGCGKCCLAKMDSSDGTSIIFTNIACRLLDLDTCMCKLYERRQEIVHDCVKIDMVAIDEKPRWVPKTCAYYLLKNGEPLPEWHPLISGDPQTVHKANVSVKGRAICENNAGALSDHIVYWEDL